MNEPSTQPVAEEPRGDHLLDALVDRIAERVVEKLEERRKIDLIAEAVLQRIRLGPRYVEQPQAEAESQRE